MQYGITQRLYRREGDDGAQEVGSFSITQKYFFDPTFGGALVSGQRNVFATLDALTPFAFADSARRFSPVVMNLQIEPGKHFDTEVILNYDVYRNRLQAIGTLMKWKPYRDSFITLAHFSTQNLPSPPNLEPPGFEFENRSNQIRALIGYGDLTRRGFNATVGASYDITQSAFQNQIAEVSYNGDCCGFGFEYRRFSIGTIRNENQYLITFQDCKSYVSAGNAAARGEDFLAMSARRARSSVSEASYSGSDELAFSDDTRSARRMLRGAEGVVSSELTASCAGSGGAARSGSCVRSSP